ncbi:MAG: hypothetical protein Q7U57_14750 [Methylovulum sp.]|nr:hypothetical protein [Methylovulum sp.]
MLTFPCPYTLSDTYLNVVIVMQNMSGIVDVAIGLVFVYLLLSLICCSLTEMAETVIFKERGKKLCTGLFELFGGDNGNDSTQKSFAFLDAFYKNPLIYSLYKGHAAISKNSNTDKTIQLVLPKNLPSYIPPKTFALAFISQILEGQTLSTATLADNIANTPLLPDDLRISLKTLVESAGNDLNAAIQNIEDWYSGMGNRVSGWYKKHTQGVTLVFACLITVLGNVDTITIAKSLMVDDTLRQEIVNAAGQYAKIGMKPSPALAEKETAANKLKQEIESLGKDSSQDGALKSKQAELDLLNASIADIKQDYCKAQALAPKQCYSAQMKQIATLSNLGLPIGWQGDDPRTKLTCANWLAKLLGWLITALSVSLGAPFWFDMLNKVMNFRSALKPQEPGDKTAEGKA